MGKMNKELTPLHSWAYLVGSLEHCKLISTGENKVIKTIETALKALEIFKRNCLLSQYPDGSYELVFPNKIQPSDEDVEILKEVLKWKLLN